jgi:hypothetical protein
MRAPHPVIVSTWAQYALYTAAKHFVFDHWDPKLAQDFLKRAADKGHAGSAYLLDIFISHEPPSLDALVYILKLEAQAGNTWAQLYSTRVENVERAAESTQRRWGAWQECDGRLVLKWRHALQHLGGPMRSLLNIEV